MTWENPNCKPRLFTTKRRAPQAIGRRTTAVSFSAEDLETLGRLVAVGCRVLQTSHKPPQRLLYT